MRPRTTHYCKVQLIKSQAQILNHPPGMDSIDPSACDSTAVGRTPRLSWVGQLEDVVQDIVPSALGYQMETLGKALAMLRPIHSQVPSHDDQNSSIISRGLGISGADIVFDFTEWEVL